MNRIIKNNRRHRYIQFHVVTENASPVQLSDFIHSVRQQQEKDISKDPKNELKFRLIQFDGTSGIIKCSSKGKDQMMRSLRSLREVDGASLNITTTLTSGTIRGLKMKKKR